MVKHMEFFKKWVHYYVGKEDRVGFWEDTWYGKGTLKDGFSNIYLLAVNRMAMVAD